MNEFDKIWNETMGCGACDVKPSEDYVSRAYIESIVEELENICINGDEHILSLLSNIKNAPSVTPTNEDIKEAYLKGYDYGVKDWFKSKTQPTLDTRQRERQLEMEYQHGYDKGWEEGRKALKQQPTNKCKGCYYEDGETHAECVICNKEAHPMGMRDATEEERKSVKDYVESISKPTGFNFYEAQPTDEDCISREAAINTAIDAADDWDGGCDAYREKMIREALEALPSVTPQRPRGKWIGSNGVNYTYPNSYTICSECKCHSDKFYKYCPNCGAEMSGGGEDEVSN